MDQLVIKANETNVITCSNCSKVLMRIPKYAGGTDILFQVIIDCPYCGDHSYEFNVCGPLRYHFPEDIQIKNVESKGIKTRFKTSLKVK